MESEQVCEFEADRGLPPNCKSIVFFRIRSPVLAFAVLIHCRKFNNYGGFWECRRCEGQGRSTAQANQHRQFHIYASAGRHQLQAIMFWVTPCRLSAEFAISGMLQNRL